MPTPIRFPTEAANSDSMQDDVPGPAARQALDVPPQQPASKPRDGEVRPGKDIEAPGSMRDKDAAKP